MPGGTATVKLPADAHVIVDPDSRILKYSAAVEAYQRYAYRR